MENCSGIIKGRVQLVHLCKTVDLSRLFAQPYPLDASVSFTDSQVSDLDDNFEKPGVAPPRPVKGRVAPTVSFSCLSLNLFWGCLSRPYQLGYKDINKY